MTGLFCPFSPADNRNNKSMTRGTQQANTSAKIRRPRPSMDMPWKPLAAILFLNEQNNPHMLRTASHTQLQFWGQNIGFWMCLVQIFNLWRCPTCTSAMFKDGCYRHYFPDNS